MWGVYENKNRHSSSPSTMSSKNSSSASRTTPRSCSNCGKVDAANKLQKCSRCTTVYYCDRECQVADWKSHKVDCKRWSENKLANKTLSSKLDCECSLIFGSNCCTGNCAKGRHYRDHYREHTAYWHVYNGREVFTGIVKLPSKKKREDIVFFKLNDPKGPLDGPGHVMSQTEWM